MKKITLTLLLLALCATLATAQTTTGSIYGTVKTVDGLVITDVKITLTAEHAVTLTITTGERGSFRFGELPIGMFNMTFEKEGYQTLIIEGVMVRIAAASRVDATLEVSAVEQTITITGETALVDLKKTGTATNLSQSYLSNIPSARDPWVILDQVAGLQVDRVNVGGSESGQQSNFVSKGDDGNNVMWNVDGVTITDMSSMSSPNYWDFDSFEEMQITTSGADASIQTAGVALNMITKQGSDSIHGQGSIYYTNDSLQGSNIPSDLETQGYSGNQIDSIKDYGFDVGGPIWKGNIWFWGAYRVQDIVLLTIAGDQDTTKLENYNLKFTGQAGDRNRWTFFYTRGEKIKSGRGAAWNRPPETTHDQSGPTDIFKIENTFLATDELIINAKFAYMDSMFLLLPKGGDAVPTYDYATDMYGGSRWYYDTTRPQYQLSVTGENYVEQAFGGSHEIKAGFEYRVTPVTSLSGYGAGMLLAYDDGEPAEAWLTGDANFHYRGVRTSFYLMDTFNLDRLTFNVGIRYDRQWGNNTSSLGEGNPIIPDLIPDLDYTGADAPFTWSNFVPRLGMTYDIFGDGKTILRASFAMYADQLSAYTVTYNNPLVWREVEYAWTDTNGDNSPQGNELGDILWWTGLNPYDTSNPLDNGVSYSSDLKAPITTEFLIGAEREIFPNLSISGTYVYRRYTDGWWQDNDNGQDDNLTFPDDNWLANSWVFAGTIQQGGYSIDYYEPTVDPSGTVTIQQRPDYHRVYQGIELSATKRLSDNWMANASFSYGNTNQYLGSPAAYMDPTGIDNVDGYSYAPISSGSGKSDIFINSRWAFKTSVLYQFPFDINASGYFSLREGFAHPIRVRSDYREHNAGRAYAFAEPLGSIHLPNVALFDLRVEKIFKLQDYGRLGLIMDVFNVFNSNTALGKNRNVWQSNFGQITEIVNPRIFRFGVRFQF